MKPLVIFHHLGFGDHLICNAIVRKLAKGRPTILLCLLEYLPSVKFLYSDMPEVTVVPIPPQEHMQAGEQAGQKMCAMFEDCGYEVRKFGYLGDPTFSHDKFDQGFYRQAGMDFEERWSEFTIPEMRGLIITPTPYAFVHEYETPTRKFLIRRDAIKLPTFTLDNNSRPENLLEAIPAILAAIEIHVIPSWCFVLADSLPDRPDIPLFLHRYARPDANLNSWRKNWTILD